MRKLIGALALAMVAGLAGALMGVVWNYSMSTLLVWRAK